MTIKKERRGDKMFKNIADELSIMLMEKGIIKPENREFYFYGLHLAIGKLFFFLVILIISLLTKTFFLSMAFVFMYSAIRQFSGGHHCRSEVSCFLVSMLLYLVMLLFYDIDMQEGRIFLCAAAFVSVVLILIFSPIEHENKPLSVVERRKYGIISKIIAIIMAIIVCVSLLLNIDILFYSSSYTLTADAVLIIFALKGVKYHECNSESDSSDC